MLSKIYKSSYKEIIKSNNFFTIHFFSLIVALLPIALITGPALPDIFISLIGIYFIIISIIKKLSKYYLNYFFYISFSFCLYLIVRSIFSDYPIISLTEGGSVFYFRYIFFSLAIWYLLEKSTYLHYFLIISVLICLIILSVDGFYQYMTGYNFLGYEKMGTWRLTGLFKDEPILGRYISFFSIFGYFLLVSKFNDNSKIHLLSWIILLAGFVITYLSGERVPLFYILFFILVAFTISKINQKLILFLSMLFTVIIIIAINLINPSSNQRIIDQTINQISNTTSKFMPYSKHHEEHYIGALKMFSENPKFGIGTNLFRHKCNEPKFIYKRSCNTHPHNYYIQLLAENGIIGLSFLLFFYFFAVFIFLSRIYNDFFIERRNIYFNKTILLCIILIIIWFPFVPHMSFYNNWYNVMLMLPIGFLLKELYG